MKRGAVISITFLTAGFVLMTLPVMPAGNTGTANATLPATAWVYLPLISKCGGIYCSQNLSGHSIAAECNPGGGTSCTCSTQDVSIVSDNTYGEVTSNVRRTSTHVNAIGYKKFIELFPSSQAIVLGVYTYTVQVSLPAIPVADVAQRENPESVHVMIQLFDGRNALWQADERTLEGTLYWDINPWRPITGTIKVYTKPLNLVDTGIRLLPDDTDWHTLELVVDFASQRYVSATIDHTKYDLGMYELAQVDHHDWAADEVFMSITTESLAAWPQYYCPYIFTWTTRFRNIEFK